MVYFTLKIVNKNTGWNYGSRQRWLEASSFGVFERICANMVTLDNAPFDNSLKELTWSPLYPPLKVLIFGKGSGMVSSLAKHARYQLLQVETVLELLYV